MSQQTIETQAIAATTDDLKPAFLDDEGPSEPYFSHYRTISASEIFDQQPGETLGEAIARKAAKG
jgi:hypothetical protein